MRPVRISGLQWGRAIAALSVVLGHSIAHPMDNSSAIAHFMGRFGVTLFFVISGFIIVLTTGDSRFGVRKFVLRRFLRVAPLYYAVTFFTAVLAFFLPTLFRNTPFDIPHILWSLTFIPSYSPGHTIDPFVRLGWTLNYEIFFYAVFACFAWVSSRTRVIAVSIIFLLLVSLGAIEEFELAALVFYTRNDLLAFIFGMLLGLTSQQESRTFRFLSSLSAFWIALSVLVCTAVYYSFIRTHPLTQIVFVATCGVFIAYVSKRKACERSRLGILFSFLGDASYSIYLFHLFAVGAVTAAAVGLKLPVPITALFGLVSGTLLGIVGYLWVELPLTSAAKRLHFKEQTQRIDGPDRRSGTVL